MDALLPILRLARVALTLYGYLVLASVILSWLTFGGADHPSMRRAQEFLHTITDPFLAPLRRLLMPLSQRIGLDFSPFIGIMILRFIAGSIPG